MTEKIAPNWLSGGLAHPNLRKSWESREKVLRLFWKYSDTFLRKLWETPEKFMKEPWDSPEKVLRKFWERFKKKPEEVLRKYWKSLKKVLRKSLNSFSENLEKVLRKCQKYISTLSLSFPPFNWTEIKFLFLLYLVNFSQAFKQIQLLIRWKLGDDWRPSTQWASSWI